MIHSCAGGTVREKKFFDFAKVQLLEGENAGKSFFFLCGSFKLEKDDLVEVPTLDGQKVRGKVLRVDKHVNEQCCPISPKHAKEILRKL